jgi:hypothetical protein
METPRSRLLPPTSPFRQLLPLAAWFGPSVGALAFLIGALSIPGLNVNVRGALLLIAILLVALAVPGVILGIQSLRRARGEEAQIEVLANGIEVGDYELMRSLFPNSREARLTPLAGGYSGAAVFQAQSWGVGAALQRSSVVKVGNAAKLQPEVENYERYVREYVGNTATLMHVAQRGNRIAMRWAYAAFTGSGVRTLADYAADGAPLVPVIDELFSARSTLGMLLGTPRRDPARALYHDYTWTPRDWQRVLRAATEVLGDAVWQPELKFATPAVPNPLPLVSRWCGLETGTGERSRQTFDVPITTIHGDLNSRNILIDDRGAIFIIDFAHTGPGHLLRDFARLETELTLVVDQPVDDTTIAERLRHVERLLRSAEGRPCVTLRDLLQSRPTEGRLAQAVVALRRHAHDFSGPWLNGPAAPYLLALLHTTLDTLRYAQCGPPAKRAALLIAGRLCQELNRTTLVIRDG